MACCSSGGGATLYRFGAKKRQSFREGYTIKKVRRGKRARGMRNPKVRAAVEKGKRKHAKFAKKVKKKAKKGWKSEEPIEGTKLKPDATGPTGRPYEYKPKTPSGIRKGESQLKAYEQASGKRGRVLYYKPD